MKKKTHWNGLDDFTTPFLTYFVLLVSETSGFLMFPGGKERTSGMKRVNN